MQMPHAGELHDKIPYTVVSRKLPQKSENVKSA